MSVSHRGQPLLYVEFVAVLLRAKKLQRDTFSDARDPVSLPLGISRKLAFLGCENEWFRTRIDSIIKQCSSISGFLRIDGGQGRCR